MRYDLVVTSCNRHDLLKQTLESFIACSEATPFRTIIVEDGPTPRPQWLDRIQANLGGVTWLNNEERMGQIYSIDRAYALTTSPYIFHLEDDWAFFEQAFIRPSEEILEKNPDIVMVGLRSEWNHPLVSDGRAFKIAEPYWRGVWGGIAFNPGLRRKSDYERIGGSYGRHVAYGASGLAFEQTLSKLYLDLGYKIAQIPGKGHCYHIGGSRSRAVEKLEYRLPRILIAVPACDNFDYGRWESEQSPHFKAGATPYGTDIHISGSNPRIDAVRDTWWKDVEPFQHHVDARFFYGTPQRRELRPDEVLLTCPDDYASLPLKTREICKYALNNDYDFVLKCDDDTAVYVDRLVSEIITLRPEYGGYVNGSDICSGGCGYILNKRGMRAVVNHGNPTSWAEDVNTGHALDIARIKPVGLPHMPGFAAHWFFPEKFDPSKLTKDLVAFHAVQPEMLRVWHEHISRT